MTEVTMKAVERWILLIALYALLDLGAHEGLWPMLMHFRHGDWQVPSLLDGIVNWVLIPSGLACLLTVSVRRELQESLPWPLLLAPFVLATLTKYVGDAFYPPYATEFLTLLVAGVAEAVSVWAGWYVWHRLSGSGPTLSPKAEAPRPA
jgi:hypothetical protein